LSEKPTTKAKPKKTRAKSKVKTRITPHPRRARFGIPEHVPVPRWLSRDDLEKISLMKKECSDLSWQTLIALYIENTIIQEAEQDEAEKLKEAQECQDESS